MEKNLDLNPVWARKYLQMLDEAGVESVWCGEHPVVAHNLTSPYPYTADGKIPVPKDYDFFDPLEYFAFGAAITERIKFVTAVLILPLHSPAILAKRIATLDALSGGRLLIGVGSGWQAEEFQAVGVPFEERGARLDEGVDAMRALWTQPLTTYRGRFYDLDQLYSYPKPVNPDGIPIIVGGSTKLAARRAGRIGDGFCPAATSPEELAALAEEMRATAVSCGRDPDKIEISYIPSPLTAFDLPTMKAYADVGVSRLITSPQFQTERRDLEGCADVIKRFQDEIFAQL